eukprot:Gb_32065 [translate_table: standard]
MESNRKGVSINGIPLPNEAGEIDFGELGTKGQHRFYQLIHQGWITPCDFIVIIKSQRPVHLKEKVVSNHDKLMCNVFAQSNALAYGKTPKELRNHKVADIFKDSTELEEATRFVKNNAQQLLNIEQIIVYLVFACSALEEKIVDTTGDGALDIEFLSSNSNWRISGFCELESLGFVEFKQRGRENQNRHHEQNPPKG